MGEQAAQVSALSGELPETALNSPWGQEPRELVVRAPVGPPSWPPFAPLLKEGFNHMVPLRDREALPSSEIPGFGEWCHDPDRIASPMPTLPPSGVL